MLALGGVGFGMAVRQVGSVVGVAALGALVNAHLTTDLSQRLNQLGVPTGMQGLITAAIEQGEVPTDGARSTTQTYGDIVQRVIGATFGAFRDGLHEALQVSAGLMRLAAGYTPWTARWSSGSGR